MVVNLLKMAVGVTSVAHLRGLQQKRLREATQDGQKPVLRHWTRNIPVRSEEICNGGSLYWIIKGAIRVRQKVTAIERNASRESRKRCAFILDDKLVLTELKLVRPIQGWRYLAPEAAPKDVVERDHGSADLPVDMAEELRRLGLL